MLSPMLAPQRCSVLCHPGIVVIRIDQIERWLLLAYLFSFFRK
jgi:hypothetical protein